MKTKTTFAIAMLWLMVFNLRAATLTVTGTADNGADILRDALAVAVDGPCTNVTFYGTATGSWIPAGTYPTWAAPGDFNGDGNVDLAVPNAGTYDPYCGCIHNGSIMTILLGDGLGEFTEAPGSPVNVGVDPWFAATADLNEDGKLDMAVANRGDNTITILLGDGQGGFAAATGSPVRGLSFPRAIAIGDFNGDGNPDLAVANENIYSTFGTVSILLGDGKGGFVEASGSPTAVGAGPVSIAVADFNGDGNPDLATADSYGPGISVLLGNGSGGFARDYRSPVAVCCQPVSVAAGDLNGDGKPDLVVSHGAGGLGNGAVTAVLGDGTGGFHTAAGSPLVLPLQAGSIALGDLNADGKLDVVVANNADANITILLGDGHGALIQAPGFPVGVAGSANSAALADFNNDGKADIVSANGTADKVSVLLGTGDGGFAGPMGSNIQTGFGCQVAVIADLNGDGIPDIATANREYSAPYGIGSGTVTILLGNGAGEFEQAAGSPVAVGSDPESIAAGDFNGDGKPDLVTADNYSGDLTVLLGNGSGGFTATNGPTFACCLPDYVAVADFNNDGKDDVAVVDRGGTLKIGLGNGAGGFDLASGSPIAVGYSPKFCKTGDFNGDGKPDLVIGNNYSTQLTVLLGTGIGEFIPAPGSPLQFNGTLGAVAIGDFNGDGKPDLAASVFGTSETVEILLGDGSGGFLTAGSSPAQIGLSPDSIAIGDFNNDGILDLATASSSGDVSVLIGDGAGGLSQLAASPFRVAGMAQAVAAGDLNGDGRSDLVTANFNTAGISVLLNVCADSRPPTDSDSDGVLDAVDLCPDTPAKAIVDEHGCSIDQLVPCSGPGPGGRWKNHGEYVSTIARTASHFVATGRITERQSETIVKAAANSNCGKR